MSGVQSVFSAAGLGVTVSSCVKVQSMRRAFILASVALLAGSGLARAQPLRGDQDLAYEAARSGQIRPLGEILGRVSGRVPGNFIGSEFDPGTKTYRLKYMQNGTVRYIDVDARTGRVIGTSGN